MVRGTEGEDEEVYYARGAYGPKDGLLILQGLRVDV